MSVRWDEATRRLGIPYVGIEDDRLSIFLADDCDIVIEKAHHGGGFIVKIACDDTEKILDLAVRDGRDLYVTFKP